MTVYPRPTGVITPGSSAQPDSVGIIEHLYCATSPPVSAAPSLENLVEGLAFERVVHLRLPDIMLRRDAHHGLLARSAVLPRAGLREVALGVPADARVATLVLRRVRRILVAGAVGAGAQNGNGRR